MNRNDVANYLGDQYSALIAAAYPGATTTPDVLFGAAIDAALRAQGVAQSDLAAYLTDDTAATQDDDTLALADYYALRLLWRQLAVMADVQSALPQVQKKQSQLFTQTKVLLDQAEAEIAHRGYGPHALQLGRIQLDLFEPLQSGSIQYNPWWGS
jgi:hypothetical protein